MKQPKLILQTDIVRIEFTGKEHRVLIRLSEGGWLEHNPFPGDLRGLVSAMCLATDCLLGKFFPRAVLARQALSQEKEETRLLE